MFPFFLYIITGLTVGIQLYSMMIGVIEGVPVRPTMYMALLGSLGLVMSAVASLFKPRVAASIAFTAVLFCWLFYVPTATSAIMSVMKSEQALEVVYVQWSVNSAPLSVKPSPYNPHVMLNKEEVSLLEAAGVTGQLTVAGWTIMGKGPKSRAVIIMSHQLEAAIDLLQPDKTQIIYLQDGQNWKMLPPTAPLIQRTIRLEISRSNPLDTLGMIELPGSRQGGSALKWPESTANTVH